NKCRFLSARAAEVPFVRSHSEEFDNETEKDGGAFGENWSGANSDSAEPSTSADSLASTSTSLARSRSMTMQDELPRSSRRAGESNRRTKSDVDTTDKCIAQAMAQSRRISAVSESSVVSLPADAITTFTSSTCSSPLEVAGFPPPRNNFLPDSKFVDLSATVSGSDSDLEAETEIPPLEELLDWHTFRRLKPKERKRLEVVYAFHKIHNLSINFTNIVFCLISELFHTEKTHVRNLKVLYHVFYRRIVSLQILPKEYVSLIFANLEEILDIHSKTSKFDDEAGEKFKDATCMFCRNLQHALEALKLRIKKDQKLCMFLQDVERVPICRKLQLKDMLPMEMQRLTKYPLLFETMTKYLPENGTEIVKVRQCIERSRSILEAVNTAKRNAENYRRLEQLQKRLDTAPFDKVQHQIVAEYRSLDLRQFALIYEGALSWRLGKNKAVDLHVVLFDNLLVLLTKTSDGQRLTLRFHNINLISGKEDAKWTHCPLLKLSSLMAKNVATDPKAFFLVSTSSLGPQIYELVAQTTAEKKRWFKYITEQIDKCKSEDQQKVATDIDSGFKSSLPEDHLYEVPTSVQKAAEEMRKDIVSDTYAQRQVELVHIVSQPGLINPSEVSVCQPTIFEQAEPVLTPLEKIKRDDDVIMKCIIEKQSIVSQLLCMASDTSLSPANVHLPEGKSGRNAREDIFFAIVQTNKLLEAINERTRVVVVPNDGGTSQLDLPEVTGPSVPCSQLTQIAAPLMNHLSHLLQNLRIMEDDLRRMQQELRQFKIQKQGLPEVSVSTKPSEKVEEGVDTDDCPFLTVCEHANVQTVIADRFVNEDVSQIHSVEQQVSASFDFPRFVVSSDVFHSCPDVKVSRASCTGTFLCQKAINGKLSLCYY
ncbi:unnamed protein product, partial [Soboliphyme baturini]|uniref:DH domain-containing protein n=1 Tax=Soboliphyme baturini TaxID=241478 RepID=A0A183IQQ7_9BILA